MKCHLLFAVLSAAFVFAYSTDIVLEKVKDDTYQPVPVINEAPGVMDTMKIVEDSVAVSSDPEVYVTDPQRKTADNMATEDILEMPEKLVLEEPVMVVNSENVEMPQNEDTGRTYPLPATDVVKNIVVECVQQGSFSCVKSKMLSFLSKVAKNDKIMLTNDLSIEKTGRVMNDIYQFEQPQRWDGSESVSAEVLMERIDGFLENHELRLRVPKEIVSGELLPYVPKFLLQNIPAEMRTWKALTLGLLSIVLSGAMVIFKFTKPKVVNYEVYHYPAATPVVEHPAPAYEHHGGWSRSLDAQPLAYRAYYQA
ncbi:hypothetical protein C0J52_17083 [Blattella germanica]|nr:hypothetical protein C0J52_17083 [Blattella germanica]